MLKSAVNWIFQLWCPRCRSLGTFWRSTAQTGRRLTSSNSRSNFFSSLYNIFKTISDFLWQKVKAGNHSCLIPGWRGRNSCRKFSSKMRWILKKPQLERVSGKYWPEDLKLIILIILILLIILIILIMIRQWGTRPCQHLLSIATTSSGSTFETARSSRTGLASSSPGIAVNSKYISFCSLLIKQWYL